MFYKEFDENYSEIYWELEKELKGMRKYDFEGELIILGRYLV